MSLRIPSEGNCGRIACPNLDDRICRNGTAWRLRTTGMPPFVCLYVVRIRLEVGVNARLSGFGRKVSGRADQTFVAKKDSFPRSQPLRD